MSKDFINNKVYDYLYNKADLSNIIKAIGYYGIKEESKRKKVFSELIEDNVFCENYLFQCKDCGYRNKINDFINHSCNIHDVKLYSYIKSNSFSYNSSKVWIYNNRNYYKQMYPLIKDNKDKFIYRGVNFNSKKDLNVFIDNIDNKVITIDDITSWTINSLVAKKFALFGHKKFNQSLLLVDAFKYLDSLDSYYGVMLKTLIKPDNVIADLSNGYSNYNEKEIIMQPDNYMVEYEVYIKEVL